MKAYQTFQQAVEDLLDKVSRPEKTLRYTTEPDLTSAKLQNPVYLKPRDFIIDEIHLFEKTGKPGALTILIALSSKKHGTKILLVNAFVSYTVTNWPGLFQHFKDFIGNFFSKTS